MSAQPIDQGGPAFPLPEDKQWGGGYDGHGMSRREYLAAHAPFTLVDAFEAYGRRNAFRETVNDPMERAALLAVFSVLRYEYADAMIAAGKVRP